jgi:hypothetical protein
MISFWGGDILFKASHRLICWTFFSFLAAILSYYETSDSGPSYNNCFSWKEGRKHGGSVGLVYIILDPGVLLV